MSGSSGNGCRSSWPGIRIQRHCPRWRSKLSSQRSMTRARRKARLSIRFSGPASQRFHSSVVEMISVASMKPGRPAAAGSGNSSIVPNSPAKVLRNSPSAGSSGTTTSRGFVWATPAAACSDVEDLAGGRVGVGALVLGDLRGPAVPQRLGQHPLRVLVQGAERVGAPVSSLEREAEALGLADHADRRQSRRRSSAGRGRAPRSGSSTGRGTPCRTRTRGTRRPGTAARRPPSASPRHARRRPRRTTSTARIDTCLARIPEPPRINRQW